MKRKKGKSFFFLYLKYDNKKSLEQTFPSFFFIQSCAFYSRALCFGRIIEFFLFRFSPIEGKLVWHSLNEIMTEKRNGAMKEEILMNLLQCCALVAAFITCCEKYTA